MSRGLGVNRQAAKGGLCAAVLAAGLGLGMGGHGAWVAVQGERGRQQVRPANSGPPPGRLFADAAQAYAPPSQEGEGVSGRPTGAAGPDLSLKAAVAYAQPHGPKRAGRQRLDRRQMQDLADRCAPTVPASVLMSIVRVESGFDPLRIGVNGKGGGAMDFSSAAEAADAATRLIAEGKSVDLGLAQINSRNLAWLGLSPAQAFDPCRNLAAAAVIIERGYALALKAAPDQRPLLQTAYSLYNTGDMGRGFENGYVEKVIRRANEAKDEEEAVLLRQGFDPASELPKASRHQRR